MNIWILQNLHNHPTQKKNALPSLIFPCTFARPDWTSYWNALVHGRKRWMFLTHEDSDLVRSLMSLMSLSDCILTTLDAWLKGLWWFLRSSPHWQIWWFQKAWRRTGMCQVLLVCLATLLGFRKKPASFRHALMWSKVLKCFSGGGQSDIASQIRCSSNTSICQEVLGWKCNLLWSSRNVLIRCETRRHLSDFGAFLDTMFLHNCFASFRACISVDANAFAFYASCQCWNL